MQNSIAKIRNKYTASKSTVDKDSPILYYILRPLSYYLTLPCLKLGISANQVTFIGILFGVAGWILLGMGSYLPMLIGVILIILYDICDVVDGNIARYKGTSSAYGAYLDDVVSGAIIMDIVPFTVGIGTGQIFLGSICTIAMLARSVITEGYSAKFQAKARGFYRGKEGWSLWTLTYKVGIAVSRSMIWLLLIGAIFDMVIWVLVFWALLSICEFVAATGWTLIKSRQTE